MCQVGRYTLLDSTVVNVCHSILIVSILLILLVGLRHGVIAWNLIVVAVSFTTIQTRVCC